MKCFLLIIVNFISIYYYSVECEKLGCGEVRAVDMTALIKYEKNFWTKAYVNAELEETLPIGFINNEDLLVSTWRYSEDKRMTLLTLVPNVDKTLTFYAIKHDLDDNVAIFQSKEEILTAKIMENEESQEEVLVQDIRTVTIPSVRFALVFMRPRDDLRIYQKCDSKVGWLQINSLLMHLSPQSEQNSIMQEYKSYLQDTFENLNMPGNLTIVGNKLSQDKFSKWRVTLFQTLSNHPDIKQYIFSEENSNENLQ